jgi:hypothetical protein
MARARSALKVRRIAVVLEPGASADTVLEAAAALAARMEAELEGLFVEDMDLLHLAALPFAREIGIASAMARALDAANIERWMRTVAEDVRRALAAAAGRSTLRWSFRVTRGSPLAELCAAAAAADLVLTAHGNALNVVLLGVDPAAAEKLERELRAAFAHDPHRIRLRVVAAKDEEDLARRLAEMRAAAGRVGRR